MLKNAPTLAIGGVDTEENEHCKVLPALRVQIPQVQRVLLQGQRSPGLRRRGASQRGAARAGRMMNRTVGGKRDDYVISAREKEARRWRLAHQGKRSQISARNPYFSCQLRQLF